LKTKKTIIEIANLCLEFNDGSPEQFERICNVRSAVWSGEWLEDLGIGDNALMEMGRVFAKQPGYDHLLVSSGGEDIGYALSYVVKGIGQINLGQESVVSPQLLRVMEPLCNDNGFIFMNGIGVVPPARGNGIAEIIAMMQITRLFYQAKAWKIKNLFLYTENNVEKFLPMDLLMQFGFERFPLSDIADEGRVDDSGQSIFKTYWVCPVKTDAWQAAQRYKDIK